MSTLDIDIPIIVENIDGLTKQFNVISITLGEPNETDGRRTFSITPEVFMNEYREYINPLQIEINRLMAENKRLKDKMKVDRKPRRTLSSGEITDIKADILSGGNNTDISKEYQVSDSSISKIRISMRKEGKDV